MPSDSIPVEEVSVILNSKQTLRKRIHIAVLFCIFMGIYFPVLIETIATKRNFKSPLELVKVLFTSRYAWRIGIILSLSASLFVCYFIIRTWKQELYADKLGKKRKISIDYQPYGDAHWAEPCEYSDIAKVRPLEECKGAVLGRLTSGDDYSQCVDLFQPERLNKHILAIGSSGSGKSYSLVMPFIMQAVKQRHSVIVTDPKGDLYSGTAAYLEKSGYYVRRFDLITLSKSDGWDCMKYLRGLQGDELETGAQIFATIIVSNIEETESVYSRGSIALLKALVLYTILRDDISEEEKTIARVNEMLQKQGVSYFNFIFGYSCPSTLKPAQSAYLTFAQASPNLHGNIVSHLATGLQILQTSLVEKILSTDDIDLNLPGDKPCAYFCRFSATNNTFRFVSAMFFSLLFISLIDHADRSSNRKLEVPVDFVMDEFPSIGKIPDWLEKISNIRSYNITAIMIVQGISQIRGVYGDDAIMIAGNCGTVLDIGLNDEESAEWFQTRMGVASIVVGTEQISKREQDTLYNRIPNQVSRGVGKDHLMSISDLYNMNVDDTIIVFQHCHPIFAHKVPITAFPEFNPKDAIRDEDLPDFDNTQARRLRRLEEERRIAEYTRNHPQKAESKDEPSEAPMDFSAMTTVEIMAVILMEDIPAVRRWIHADGIRKLSFKKSVPVTEPATTQQSGNDCFSPSPDPAFKTDSALHYDIGSGEEDDQDEPREVNVQGAETDKDKDKPEPAENSNDTEVDLNQFFSHSVANPFEGVSSNHEDDSTPMQFKREDNSGKQKKKIDR